MKVTVFIESEEGRLTDTIEWDRASVEWAENDLWMVAGKMRFLLTEPIRSEVKCRAWAERAGSDRMRVVVAETDEGKKVSTEDLPRSRSFPAGSDRWEIRV